jgi:predicted nucleic acid-binding protein
MADRAFVDTNVLVYAIEVAGPDPAKSSAARELLRRNGVCLSTQVLGEFFSAVTSRKRASPLTHDEATAWVQFWKRFDVEPVTHVHVDLAIEIAGRHGIHYYDALILASARFAGCAIAYSEDLNPSQDYGGVEVANPFANS